MQVSPSDPVLSGTTPGSDPAMQSPASLPPIDTNGLQPSTLPLAPDSIARVSESDAGSSLFSRAQLHRATIATGGERYDGWSDQHRGINQNLGDTESALHLFYARHPELHGKPPANGTPQASELKGLHLWADARRFADHADPAETNWRHDDSRSLAITAADRKTAWSIYSSQHPALGDVKPKAGTPAANDLHVFERYVAQNKYNATIDHALQKYPVPDVDAKTFKALLVQESGLAAAIGTNSSGYTGIAQLGSDLATRTEANDPLTAIPIAARALQEKESYVAAVIYRKHGVPSDPSDRTKLVLGTYNAGQRTIRDAVDAAQSVGSKKAASAGLRGKSADASASAYATKWDHLAAPQSDPPKSPLYGAIPPEWGKAAKYVEISRYATEIVNRANQ